MAFTLRKHLIHEFDWEQGFFNKLFAEVDENGPTAIVKAIEGLDEDKSKSVLMALTYSMTLDLDPLLDHAIADRWDQVISAAHRAGVPVPEPSDWRPEAMRGDEAAAVA